MKKMMFVLACALSLSTLGCSKKQPSCDEVFEHTLSLAPADMRDMFEKKKDSAIEKCSKMSDEAKRCAMEAKSMEEVQKCPRS